MSRSNIRSALTDGIFDDGEPPIPMRSKRRGPQPPPPEDSIDSRLARLIPDGIQLTGTKEAIELRQRIVRRCMRMGYGPSSIAEAMKVTRATVSRDMRKIREMEKEDLEVKGQEDHIADNFDSLKNIEELALDGVIDAPPGSAERNAFLSTALRARSTLARTQTETGVVSKAPDRLITSDEADRIGKLTGPQLEQEYRDLEKKLKASGVDEDSEPLSEG